MSIVPALSNFAITGAYKKFPAFIICWLLFSEIATRSLASMSIDAGFTLNSESPSFVHLSKSSFCFVIILVCSSLINPAALGSSASTLFNFNIFNTSSFTFVLCLLKRSS